MSKAFANFVRRKRAQQRRRVEKGNARSKGELTVTVLTRRTALFVTARRSVTQQRLVDRLNTASSDIALTPCVLAAAAAAAADLSSARETNILTM